MSLNQAPLHAPQARRGQIQRVPFTFNLTQVRALPIRRGLVTAKHQTPGVADFGPAGPPPGPEGKARRAPFWAELTGRLLPHPDWTSEMGLRN